MCYVCALRGIIGNSLNITCTRVHMYMYVALCKMHMLIFTMQLPMLNNKRMIMS